MDEKNAVENCWCQGGRSAMGAPVARLEMICGLAWFTSDGCWLMLWHWPCYIAGIIAVITAIAVFFYQERTLPAMLVCCGEALCGWLAVGATIADFNCGTKP